MGKPAKKKLPRKKALKLNSQLMKKEFGKHFVKDENGKKINPILVLDGPTLKRAMLSVWNATEFQIAEILKNDTYPVHYKILARIAKNATDWGDRSAFVWLCQGALGFLADEIAQTIQSGNGERYIIEIPVNGRDKDVSDDDE